MKQGLSSKWAIKTLEQALKYWPYQSLSLIIGSDLLKDIPGWYEAKNILKKAKIGIVPRHGWPIKSTDLQMIESMGGTTYVIPLTIPPTSSSSIHEQPDLSLVPKAIMPIIKSNKLYGMAILIS